MLNNFPKSVEATLKYEGGYVNDPRDPGGETNFGISKRSFPSVDIKHLTKDEATKIYKRFYWDKVQGDNLPLGVDLVVFDSSVLCGIKRPSMWLQKAVGVNPDGVIGPVTLLAVKKADPEKVVRSLIAQRYQYLRSLSTWGTYKTGWSARCQALLELATKMIKEGQV